MHFFRLRLGQHRLEFLNPHFIPRTASGGVHQHKIQIAQASFCFAHLAGRAHHFHWQIDDFGVGAQLFDRGNAIGVDRDQPHSLVLAEAVIGG